ncbi:4-amino-4-deoxy-L-arabinose transferase [Microbacterium sp. CSI-V]|uniref:ArnT family glycosyltransferase n=1 Tax=unclassified Microbacterium TaxID=2609290 RepID=UPI00097BB620|nr:glycosyltransferase family 39 protein [Microbacterium sp. CSI-V]MXS74566.1 4-amino-4-deoxy-L-arabinose transferase [Microbacterium sp. TL13]ONI63157.1 4-amino-4-deoxy-L-arabinose transferase [Microbacterium sp. CSI-V]
MTATLSIPQTPLARPAATSRPRGRAWPWGLAAVGLVALVLTAWQVWDGAPSAYYASIALSMSQSWSNFFFGAMDPSGTVTLDKIPGSFWVPALFVRVFGYSTWAVILPNALAAVGAALITAVAARRLAGVRAGLLAGAIVAVTPIFVAVSRSNQPESFFVLGLSITAWAAIRAIQQRSFGWLVVAGAAIGLSFQFYMLEAWAVWPALAAAYLATAQSWARRIGHLLVAGAVSVVASLWWVAIVALIPAGSRPYIGSTLGDDPWEMVFGYNGLGRFGATSDSSAYESFTPPFSGEPGVFRLFNAQLAGQIAWLIPAAIVALVVLWLLRFPRPLALLLTVWLATFGAMFSVVAGMHQFYTSALAVPLALAVATALAWSARAAKAWPAVAILATAAVTAVGIAFSVGGYSIPVAIVQALIGVVAIVLLLSRHRARMVTTAAMVVGLLLTPAVWSAVTIAHPNSINPVAGGVSEMASGFGGRGGTAGGAQTGGAGGFAGAPGGAPGAGGAGGMAAPNGGAGAQDGTRDGRGARSGSGTTDGQGATGGAPGGTGGFTAGAGGFGGDQTALLSWLEQNRGGATYLAATFGAQSAAQLIVASDGEAVLPIGGFNGTDAAPTLDRFISLVESGQLRYVIAGQDRVGGPGGASVGAGDSSTGTVSAQIRSWVEQNCTTAADAPSTVYVCGTVADGSGA